MYRQNKELVAKEQLARKAAENAVKFHKACNQGKLEAVKDLLEEDMDLLETSGHLGRTPIMVAAVTGQKQLFDYLAQCEAELDNMDDEDDNLLHLACAGGSKDIVQSVLLKEVSILESRGRYGQTPILKAAYCGHLAVLDLIADKGGLTDVVDDAGDNILHVACLGGNTAMVKVILDRRLASVESKGHLDRTPVMKAVSMGHVAVFNLLVGHGSRLTVQDVNGDNILHMACLGNSADLVDVVIQMCKIDINCKGRHGRTPIMRVAERGSVSFFKHMVEKGAYTSCIDDAGDSLLHVACFAGNVDLVQYLLGVKPADLESKGQLGRTLIMTAAASGQEAIYRLLVNKGCSMSGIDANGDTLLHHACSGGKLDLVQDVLSRGGVGMESKGYRGRTPLMVAAICGHCALFQKLLHLKADLGPVDSEGNGIIHVATMGGSVDMLKLALAKSKDNVEKAGKQGRTSLMIAADYCQRDVFDFLVSLKANLRAEDKSGDNILHLACYGGDVQIVKFILSANIPGVTIETCGRHGRTPLMKSAVKGHVQLLQFLTCAGANLQAVDANNDNLLHVACQGGSVQMVETVLKIGEFDLESRGIQGQTALLKAAEFGNIETFNLLRREGAKTDAVSEYKDNVLHVAVAGGFVKMVQHVLSLELADKHSKGRFGRTSVLIAADKGHIGVLELLTQEELDLRVIDGHMDNILHLACSGGHVGVIEFVLAKKVVDLESRGNHGQTALMKSALHGYISVFDRLMKAKCNVNACDKDGNNLLHVACIGGNLQMVEHILFHDLCKIDSRGHHGRTPVLIAANRGHAELVDFLIAKGCDALAVDKKGDNILHVSCLRGDRDIVQHVLKLQLVKVSSLGHDSMCALMRAANLGHVNVLDLLVKSGGNLDVKDERGDNILHAACLGGNVVMVKYILSKNKALLESQGKYGQTPVMKAASMGHKVVFDFLESEGCDVTVVDNDGDNLLHAACYGGNAELVKHLCSLMNVTDRQKKNNAGQTPLAVAYLSGGRKDIVEILST